MAIVLSYMYLGKIVDRKLIQKENGILVLCYIEICWCNLQN